MKPTALGLTCRGAFAVFSENLSLQLQRENDNIKSRYEPSPRVFQTFEDYLKVETSALNTLHDWIQENLEKSFVWGGHLQRAIYEAIYTITQCDAFAHNTAKKCVRVVNNIISAVQIADLDGNLGLRYNNKLQADIVCEILLNDEDGEIIYSIKNAVQYPLEEVLDKYWMDLSAVSPQGGLDSLTFQQPYEGD